MSTEHHLLPLFINGCELREGQLPQSIPQLDESNSRHLLRFLQEWYNDSEHITLQSSGSTGQAKLFLAPKKALLASAQRSCDIFTLRAGQTVLLRLPASFIAAQMMVIRCMLSGATLCYREPSGQLFADLDEVQNIDFAPIVSQQAASTAIEELQRIRTLLLGGGFIPQKVEQKLQTHTGKVYASYGMTETYSHIALRRINGKEASPYYSPLDGVQLRVDEESRLIISDTHTELQSLHSNDIVQLDSDSGGFIMLGRHDNIISSGGIKIKVELIEQLLYEKTGISCIALGEEHESLGHSLILLWEGELDRLVELERAVSTELPAYQRPKRIVHIAQGLPRNEHGKINRAAAKALHKL